MPSLTSGLFQPEQNISNPAAGNLVLSYRANLTAANTSQTIALPNNSFNPAQVTPAQSATNFAPQSSPVLANNEPQQGRRLFVTHLMVRDANAALSGAAATTPASVALLDQTTGATLATVTTVANVNSPYILTPVATGVGVVAPYDQLAVVFTAQVAGTPSTATSFTVDVFGFWQQGI